MLEMCSSSQVALQSALTFCSLACSFALFIGSAFLLESVQYASWRARFIAELNGKVER